MPRNCCVVGCRSNYASEAKASSTFAVPADKERRQLWQHNIRRDLSKLKKPVVCIKHFDEAFIVRVDRCMVRGELKEFPRILPKLTPDAVPTIFPEGKSIRKRRWCLDDVGAEGSLEVNVKEFVVPDHPSVDLDAVVKEEITEETLEVLDNKMPYAGAASTRHVKTEIKEEPCEFYEEFTIFSEQVKTEVDDGEAEIKFYEVDMHDLKVEPDDDFS